MIKRIDGGFTGQGTCLSVELRLGMTSDNIAIALACIRRTMPWYHCTSGVLGNSAVELSCAPSESISYKVTYEITQTNITPSGSSSIVTVTFDPSDIESKPSSLNETKELFPQVRVGRQHARIITCKVEISINLAVGGDRNKAADDYVTNDQKNGVELGTHNSVPGAYQRNQRCKDTPQQRLIGVLRIYIVRRF